MPGRDLIGALLALVAFAAVGIAARAVRRRVLPNTSGPVSLLAEGVLGLTVVVLVGEALGTVGLFRLVPLVLVFCAVAAGAMWLANGRSFTRREESPVVVTVPPAPEVIRSERLARCWSVGALAAVAVVTAEWMARVVDSWHRGMTTVDTLWYHLPIAARFAQDGWTSRLVFVDASSLIAFYPNTSELLHATGMVFLGTDALSLVLNIGFVALGLLAAWCIGRPFGVAPVTMIGAAIVIATPQLVLDDGGSGLTDIVSLSLFLAAVALVTNAGRDDADAPGRTAMMLCGALAAGLAAGTKYTLVAPAALLAVGVLALTPRGRRVRVGAQWVLTAFVAGGYWYFRNLVRAGNPIPNMRIGLGPVRLPSVPFDDSTTFARFMFDGDAWRHYFLPGLFDAFGPVWWGIVAVAFVGAVVATASSDRTIRVLGLIALGSAVAYIFTPQILALNGAPYYFEVNARYVAPALIIGAIALPVALWHRSSRLLSAVLVGYLVLLAGTQLAAFLWRNEPSGYAPLAEGWTPRVAGVAFGLVALAIGAVVIMRRGRRSPRARQSSVLVVGGMGVALVLVVGGVAAEHYARDDRYRNALPMPTIYRWAQDVHDTRVAVIGSALQYPLLGRDLSNHVQYLAVRDGAESAPIKTCAAWRRAVNDGRYRYVVATTPGYPFPTKQRSVQADWTRSDPAARLVARESFPGGQGAFVFEIRGKLDPDDCPGDGQRVESKA